MPSRVPFDVAQQLDLLLQQFIPETKTALARSRSHDGCAAIKCRRALTARQVWS